MPNPIVFIVADEPAALDALTDLFEQANLHSETFTSAETFLAQFDPERSGCLLLDISSPGMSGAELHRTLTRRQGIIPAIILTSQSDARSAMDAFKSGALNVVEKPFDSAALLKAVKLAIEIDGANRRTLRFRAEVLHRISQLTKREREIMHSILESKTSREIADQLNMSARTVEFHRARVMKKMGAVSLVELVRMVALAFECHCVHKHMHLQGLAQQSGILSCHRAPVWQPDIKFAAPKV